MSKLKYIFLILIVAGLYFALATYIPLLNQNNSKNIIIAYDNVIHYKDNKWSFVDKKELNNIDFINTNIYDDKNDLVKKATLKYLNQWAIKNGFSYQNYSETLFGFNGFNKANVLKFNYSDLTEIDRTRVEEFLHNYKKISLTDSIVIRKIEVDLDSDYENEIIYEISDMSMLRMSYDCFSLVTIYDDNRFEVIEKSYINKLSINELNISSIYKIFDIDGDGIYEIITMNSHFSESSEIKYSMYQKQNGEYKLLVSNREGE